MNPLYLRVLVEKLPLVPQRWYCWCFQREYFYRFEFLLPFCLLKTMGVIINHDCKVVLELLILVYLVYMQTS